MTYDPYSYVNEGGHSGDFSARTAPGLGRNTPDSVLKISQVERR